MKALYFDNSVLKISLLALMSKISKNAAFWPISPTRFAEVKDPVIPNQRWLKVRNISCGLCGSDAHFIFMDVDPACFPAATPGIARKYLGHELVAEVIETGTEVDTCAIGDRVVLRIDWPSCFQMEIDPPCPQCGRGNYMLCENLGKASMPIRDTGGGFSPYMVMHKSQPFKVPDGIDNDQAIFIEPLACAVHGVLKHKPQKGDTVLVIGCGTIGLLTIAVVKAYEPRSKVYALGRYPFQERKAYAMGADKVFSAGKGLFSDLGQATGAARWKGFGSNEILLGGFDVIYDTVGNDASFKQALRLAKGTGNVVILGINMKPGKLDYTPIWNQEIRVTGINCHATEPTGRNSFEMAAEMLLKKEIPLDGLITHRFGLEDYRQAIDAFLKKKISGAIKIVIDHV